MNKVARVIRSPEASELFILSRDPENRRGERFIIEDSPQSIPIKGMSFTVAPEGPEEEIAAWAVISRDSAESRPPPSVVWRWYSIRSDLSLSESHKLAVFQFSLWDHVPPFYWIRDSKAQEIREALLTALRNRPTATRVTAMLVVASFLGKGTYSRALQALGEYRTRIAPAMREFPHPSPRAVHGSIKSRTKKQAQAQLRSAQERRLDGIAGEAARDGKEPSSQERWEAHKIDCFLYARDDQYKGASS